MNFKTLVILLPVLFVPPAGANEACFDIFAMSVAPTTRVNYAPRAPVDEVAFARHAVDIFQQAEAEVKAIYEAAGKKARFNNPELASQLAASAKTLEGIPESPNDFIRALYELSAILKGELTINHYSRRDQVGWQPLVVIKHWSKLDGDAFRRLSETVFANNEIFRKNIVFKGLGNNRQAQNDLILSLLRNPLAGIDHFPLPDTSTDQVTVSNFKMLASNDQGPRIFQISGRRMILTATGQKRIVILGITNASHADQAQFFRAQAKAKGYRDQRVALPSRYSRRPFLEIPARILYKLQYKHDVTLQQLTAALATGEVVEIKPLEPENYLLLILDVGDRRLRLILFGDPRETEAYLLKTAYEVNSPIDEADAAFLENMESP